MDPVTPSSGARTRSKGRPSWLARGLLVVGAPLTLLCALEGALRLGGYGRATDLFIPDSKSGFYRTNPSFTAPYFPPQFDITPLNFRIARHKEAGHLRVFVLGESAVRGTPEPGFGFASQLGAQLKAAYPAKAIEVCNLGMVAINSHVVYQAAREAAQFEPDLFVVYMGNNEVVGPFGPESANLSWMPPLALIRASAWIGRTRTGQLIQALAKRLAGPASGGVQWHGMSTFTGKTVRGDDPRLEEVYRNYEANLRDIAAVASRAGIPIVLATVVANLRDCPPFASAHRDGMTAAELERWAALYKEGTREWELGQPDEAVRLLTEALKLDPEYAEAHFVMGRLRDGAGDTAGAREHYLRALHWDALRFRPDGRINDIARRVASDSGGRVLLLDTAVVMGSDPASVVPPCGSSILLEHVHFNWDGNVAMGRMLAAESARALFGPAAAAAPWLDSDGCARALGYTDLGRLRMLRQMESIRGKPPFTGQLTFGEDQARYQREIDLAEQRAASGEALASARALLEAAVAAAPLDPGLELLLSELEARAGRPERELACIDRALELLPRSPELLVARARALGSLRRYLEAQDVIQEALRMDPYNLPTYTAMVEVLRQTGDFELGQRLFTEALARAPGSGFIRLAHADLLFFHGDRDEAVRECKDVLAREPENTDALRRLVSLFEGEGRADEVFAQRMAARSTQPMNFENNLALARMFESRGDEAAASDCLSAAAASGPATAQAHLFIAHHLSTLGRHADERVELARARRLALIFGDGPLARSISEMMP
jgi:tetratricopeptide (TPR) repeat protein